MHFIDDAGKLWHRFWSLRFALLAASLNAASVAVMLVLPERTSVRIALAVGVLSFSSSIASAYARMVKQPKLQGDDDADH